MRFSPPLVRARLLRRYKRFFLDAELTTGTIAVAHCPNTGSLMGCLTEGSEVLLAPAKNPERATESYGRACKLGLEEACKKLTP